jgi:hypothetical protein
MHRNNDFFVLKKKHDGVGDVDEVRSTCQDLPLPRANRHHPMHRRLHQSVNTRSSTIRRYLVPIKKLYTPSYRMFRDMHGTLNINKK